MKGMYVRRVEKQKGHAHVTLKGGVAEKMRVKASSNLVSGNLDELL